jgi:polyisoprenoid-binding protein YceI
MTAKSMIMAVALVAAPSLCFAGETYQADTIHSSVVFRVKHMNTSYAWGRFNDITGTFSIDKANLAESKLDFKVKTDSIDTANAKRDQHLKGPDFFNVVQHKTISFVSKSVTPVGESYEVNGDLTLHGVTKPVTVKVSPTGEGAGPMGGKIAGIEATFTIKRSEFGMNKMVGPVADDVWVTVSVEGGLKK